MSSHETSPPATRVAQARTADPHDPQRAALRLLPPVARAPLPIDAIGRAVDWSVVALGAALVALVFSNVVMRLLTLDAAFVIELGELLMVWVTFLGGASAARRNAHMTITEFVDKLDEGARRWADAAIQALCLAVLAVLSAYGISLVQASWGNILTVLGIAMAWQYLALPAGSVAMAVFIGWDLLQILRGVPRSVRYGAG